MLHNVLDAVARWHLSRHSSSFRNPCLQSHYCTSGARSFSKAFPPQTNIPEHIGLRYHMISEYVTIQERKKKEKYPDFDGIDC